MLAILIQGLGLGLSAAATPGPFQAYLLAQTLQSGWRRTLPAALAPLLSDGPIITLIVLALSRVPLSLLDWLRLAGGVFLLYLAWGAWQAFRRFDPQAAAPASRSLGQAALINALSPGPWLFWSLIGAPLLITAWQSDPRLALAYLLGFYGGLLGVNASLVLVFGAASRFGAGLRRALLGVSVGLLAGLGVWQVYLALSALLGGG